MIRIQKSSKGGKGVWRKCPWCPEGGLDYVMVTCPDCGTGFWLRGYKVLDQGIISGHVHCENPKCEFEECIQLMGYNDAL